MTNKDKDDYANRLDDFIFDYFNNKYPDEMGKLFEKFDKKEKEDEKKKTKEGKKSKK